MFGTPTGVNVQRFYANSQTAGGSWHVWQKPKNCSFVQIWLFGCGGNGGNGAVGANSTAAGGGGGGSGGQIQIMIPAWIVPDRLFMTLAFGGTAISSYVSFDQTTTAQSVLLQAFNGGNGGNAAGATAGAAGAAAGVAGNSTMIRNGMGLATTVAGQAGIVGGVAVAGANQTAPITSLNLAGGTGGGGLPAAAAVGTAGGSFTGSGVWPSMAGGTSAGASSAGTKGADGLEFYNGIWLPTPGCGGASGGGTTGAGGNGGDGATGCGGGGGGGAITGQVAGVGGRGGGAHCIVTWW
jgi:hypothetical protein